MFKLDRRNNITLNIDDNGIIDFSLCGETLKTGDIVEFKSDEQDKTITEFNNGVAKIQIDSKRVEVNGNYYIRVRKRDGRKSIVISGKYIRKGGGY